MTKKLNKKYQKPTYILTEEGLYNIDGLINLLNLAINEIITGNYIHHQIKNTDQKKFNEKCYEILEKNSPK
jgi:hypothetical protein